MIRMKFAEFLNEYRRAPLGGGFSKIELSDFLADEEHLEQLRTHTCIPGVMDFVIYEYAVSSTDRIFIMTDRKDRADIAGYLWLRKKGRYWLALATEVFSKYQNRGLGTDLHVKAIQAGYDLINGYSLSGQEETVWKKKLPKHVNVEVINLKNGKVEKFSDKPTSDVAIEDDDQEWFYLATSKHATLEGLAENFHRDDIQLNIRYERWLRNDPGCFNWPFMSSKYGEDGDY